MEPALVIRVLSWREPRLSRFGNRRSGLSAFRAGQAKLPPATNCPLTLERLLPLGFSRLPSRSGQGRESGPASRRDFPPRLLNRSGCPFRAPDFRPSRPGGGGDSGATGSAHGPLLPCRAGDKPDGSAQKLAELFLKGDNSLLDIGCLPELLRCQIYE